MIQLHGHYVTLDHGLLFRNLALNETTSTDLAAMIEKSGFGEIESLEMFKLADEKIARIVFANKKLDLENIKDAFNGIIWENQPIFVDLIEIEGFFRISTSRFKETSNYPVNTAYLGRTYICMKNAGAKWTMVSNLRKVNEI